MNANGALPFEARGRRKRHAHVAAVDGIDLTVRAGNVYAVCG